MHVKALQLLTLSLLCLAPIKLTAQINVSDSLALVELYDSTNGVSWRNNTNWKTLAPVKTWQGISVGNDRVVAITMYGNNVSGTIPPSFKNLTGMVYIDLLDNGFGGDLLLYISDFKELTRIHIGEQYLLGPFPSALGYLPKLTSLYIYGPGINGPIPKSFGHLKNLNFLDVSSSAHSGYIPCEELSNLNFGPYSLILSNNRYTFGELEPLVEIFRAKNKEDALQYSYQAQIATLQHNDKLVISAGGVLSHNTYRWYKEGTGLLATITGDSSYTPTLPGTYYASVTNLVATQLTLNSIPIKAAAVVMPVCPLSTPFSINSDVNGTSYQWQESVDTITFNNITDNENYSGTQKYSLQLQNIPSSWYGRKYRCISAGINSTVFTIYFANHWVSAGTATWENASNWSCGEPPDINTDVTIDSGTVVLNSNVTVRSLALANGVTFTVSPGYKLTIIQ